MNIYLYCVCFAAIALVLMSAAREEKGGFFSIIIFFLADAFGVEVIVIDSRVGI